MFAHVLAVLLGIGSVMFYVAAFFYPEVHRRSDIFLSGAGMLYAVLLWFCAGQMTVAVALSQMMAIALLMFLGWQTLSVRREKTPVYQQTPVALTPELVGDWAKNTVNQLRIAPADKVRPLRPQNPSLNGTSADRFRQPIDPRRRPVYDYEFVEDGIAADAPGEAVVDDVTALVEEVPNVVPPSAEAEVLVTEVPEAETSQREGVRDAISDDESNNDANSEDFDSEAFNSEGFDSKDFDSEGFESVANTTAKTETDLESKDSDVSEEIVREEIVSNEEIVREEIISDEEIVSESDNTSEIGIAVDNASVANQFVEDKSVEDKPIENESTDTSDDWGFLEEDDDFDSGKAAGSVLVDAPQSEASRRSRDTATQPPASGSPQRLAQAPAEKPAIWAMPIILVGWLKDVVTSMAKPKPSKPMIEIPRRETGQSVANNNVASNVASNLVNEQPTNSPVDSAAVQAPLSRPSDSQSDDFMSDSNDDNFDDFNQANWVERAEDIPKVVVNNRADETANETIEESNWDD